MTKEEKLKIFAAFVSEEWNCDNPKQKSETEYHVEWEIISAFLDWQEEQKPKGGDDE